MRYIFLDCGAHIGQSAEFFNKHHPEADKFEILCFEPLSDNILKLSESNVIRAIYPFAVYTYNGTEKFYTGLSESGSLNGKKRTGGLDSDTFINVHTIDFVEFLKNNTKKTDYIICKMNIEGAEYPVIEYLHNQGMIDWIDKWYVNWHWNKIKMCEDEHNRISLMIPDNTRWDAMFGESFIKKFKDSL